MATSPTAWPALADRVAPANNLASPPPTPTQSVQADHRPAHPREPAARAQPGAVVESLDPREPASSPSTGTLPARSANNAETDWSAFGAVIPVLAGSSGAGASVLAAALVDVLQRAGRCVLLVDTAEPSRSGLACAAAVEGPWTSSPAPELRVRYSWRDHALVARREAAHPGAAPPPITDPHGWLPVPPPQPLHVTVVDVGQEWLRPVNTSSNTGGDTGSDPSGEAVWLRAGRCQPRPLLVVRATRPSLVAAEEALARFDAWMRGGQMVRPARLVVMAAWKRSGWPSGVTGAAGSRVSALLDDALVVPYDRSVELGGVTDEPIPPRIQSAVKPLLAEWGLLAPTNPWP